MVAGEDEDSETAHYVAAAKMEICRLQQKRWSECKKAYEAKPQKAENYHNACASLIEMLGSNVLSRQEKSAYRKRLCLIVSKQMETDDREVTLKEYEEYLAALVELERYQEAEALWGKKGAELYSEKTFFR